jgi:hypothetical protein
MADDLEVSFNSPQCGWMSVGFTAGDSSFHTTTAHAPHENALGELLGILAELAGSTVDLSARLNWNRDPEAYDLVFTRTGGTTRIEIFEFPTEERTAERAELVFTFEGPTDGVCRAFYETFRQLFEEREADEFEQNWRQPFPVSEFERFDRLLNTA